ncbi:MAG TPA: multiheme c-type cytochrome [Candidatus Aminicenantes bacterium]|nr:multiheme c-type cytochrome [Candidatus Aminicenantes bacterium]
MTRKTGWIGGLFMTAPALLIFGAGIIGTKPEKAPIPEYIGSQACLGCHAETYSRWKASNHASSVVPIINSSDLPQDISTAPAKLQGELRKAAYMLGRSLFTARDPETQHYLTLGVRYDARAKAYVPGPSYDWSVQCAGCHVTNMDTPNLTWGEPDVGCEACHGPGRDHVLGKGDAARIVRSKAADICGQCHGSNDRAVGGRLMADGTYWMVGFRPGMKLTEVEGLRLTPVDPAKIPPDVKANHLGSYNLWLASGHARALETIRKSRSADDPECYACHAAEGFAAKRQGRKVDIGGKGSFHALTCVACHDPHSSPDHRQLVAGADKLCVICHFQQAPLAGDGAVGIEKTVVGHSDVGCVSCHMTEANHLMKVIRPDDPGLTEGRQDTCSTCHKDSGREALGVKLREIQSSYTAKMEPLQADLKALGDALKDKPGLLTAGLKSKYEAVRKNLGLLSGDGSRGAHNFEYAAKILDRARADLDEIKAAVSRSR